MTIIKLDIGEEEGNLLEDAPKASKHMLDLKAVDGGKKAQAHAEVSVDLKEEIKHRSQEQAGRICIVGELPASKQGLGRMPMVAAAVFVILILNLGQVLFLGQKEGGEALALASEAFLSLQGASQSVIAGAGGEAGSETDDVMLFQQAEQLFQEAESKSAFLLNFSSPWISEPAQVTSLRNVLDAGGLMSEVGQHIAAVQQELKALPEEGSLTEFLRSISENHLEVAADKLREINTLLDDVDLSGTGYEEKFTDYRGKLTTLLDLFDLWIEAKEPVLAALGDRYPQHYLVLLMNNDEMRLGGGFIGSFAIVELNDGRLTDMEFHDVYEFDNLYHEHVDVPVHELRELTSEWRLRDSNISPDFPTTAEYAMQFLDLEGGPGVDGVIGLNLSAAQGMIEELGSLSLASLPLPLTAENFPAVLSTLVEAKTSGQSSPKAILSELIDAFVASLSGGTSANSSAVNAETAAKLGLRALDEINKKQILLYHTDASVQGLLTSLGLDAALPDLALLDDEQIDFVLPAFTNIGANKTDRYMQTDLSHHTQIFGDGSLVDSMTITRTHTFNDATFAWLAGVTAQYGFTSWTPELRRVLGDDTNHTGIRIYVPEGAAIIDVTGSAHRDDLQFYYDKETDMSYYYLDQTVEPGSSESFTVTYSLPWKFRGEFQNYDFQLFKQPGLKAVTYQKTVTAPDDILLSGEPVPSAPAAIATGEVSANAANSGTDEAVEPDYTLSGSFVGDVSITLLYR